MYRREHIYHLFCVPIFGLSINLTTKRNCDHVSEMKNYIATKTQTRKGESPLFPFFIKNRHLVTVKEENPQVSYVIISFGSNGSIENGGWGGGSQGMALSQVFPSYQNQYFREALMQNQSHQSVWAGLCYGHKKKQKPKSQWWKTTKLHFYSCNMPVINKRAVNVPCCLLSVIKEEEKATTWNIANCPSRKKKSERQIVLKASPPPKK